MTNMSYSREFLPLPCLIILKLPRKNPWVPCMHRLSCSRANEESNIGLTELGITTEDFHGPISSSITTLSLKRKRSHRRRIGLGIPRTLAEMEKKMARPPFSYLACRGHFSSL